MKKHFPGVIAVSMVAAVAVWNVSVNLNSRSSDLSGISLANVDAYAFDLEKWWNRPDYDCVSVTCNAIT